MAGLKTGHECYKAAMLRRRFLLSGLASATLTGLVGPASAATTIRFVTDWKAQAEHGGCTPSAAWR